jgi:GDP-L-fucose synthase
MDKTTRVVGDGTDAPDFNDAGAVERCFDRFRPEYVLVAGGKSGGIKANQKYPVDLMLDNLRLETNVITTAFHCGVTKLLYLASSCCYPKHCPQPMKVESLLTGPLEPTNEAYAVAKIAGLKLCQAYRQQHGANFITGIVADIFGPGEHLDLDDLHVVPALIQRMDEAKRTGKNTVEIWGTGNPRREFIYVDDLADACVFVMDKYEDDKPINLGGGHDMSIGELAKEIREVVGFEGELRFDTSKPDGMPLKILDSSELRRMGWKAATLLRSALQATYDWISRASREPEKATAHD